MMQDTGKTDSRMLHDLAEVMRAIASDHPSAAALLSRMANVYEERSQIQRQNAPNPVEKGDAH